MTRTEFIAETAVRLLERGQVGTVQKAVAAAIELVRELEARELAPWPQDDREAV